MKCFFDLRCTYISTINVRINQFQKEEISQLILVSGPSSTPVMSENESIVQNKSIPRHFIVDMEEGIHIYDNVTSYSIDVTDLR